MYIEIGWQQIEGIMNHSRKEKKDSFLLLCKFNVSTQNLTLILFNITPTSHLRNIPLRVQISFNIIHFIVLNIEYIKKMLKEHFCTQTAMNRFSSRMWLSIALCRANFLNFQLHKFRLLPKCFARHSTNANSASNRKSKFHVFNWVHVWYLVSFFFLFQGLWFVFSIVITSETPTAKCRQTFTVV